MKRNENRAVDRWSVPVAVDDLPDTGGHYELSADAQARAAVAKIADLPGVTELQATLDVVRRGAGVQVSGEVTARVVQNCVVTLEPIENDVRETVDLLFAEQSETEPDAGPRRRKKGDEPPEPLVGGVIDLGALATEFVILGLDPYPRKAGAEFAPPALEEGRENPFQALEALKKRPGSNLK